MFAVAGKTAESNWLTFFEETQSYRGGDFVTGNANVDLTRFCQYFRKL